MEHAKRLPRIPTVGSTSTTASWGDVQVPSKGSISQSSENAAHGQPTCHATTDAMVHRRLSVPALPEQADSPALYRRNSLPLNMSRHPSKHSPDLADLAHKFRLPLSTVRESSELFRQYAKLPGLTKDEDMLRDGILFRDGMMQLVSNLSAKESNHELVVSPNEIMGVVDRNWDGTVCFHEFATWYHERGFEEYMNLTKDEIELRRIGHRLGIVPADIEFYKKEFDKFDVDSSGFIDYPEFKELMHILMKVSKGLKLPESRLKHFWHEADKNNDGTVCLEEFVKFYTKHFGADPEEDPVEDYYRSIRRPIGVY
jgi:Ca2+-binding EF-hand superfamily protein